MCVGKLRKQRLPIRRRRRQGRRAQHLFVVFEECGTACTICEQPARTTLIWGQVFCQVQLASCSLSSPLLLLPPLPLPALPPSHIYPPCVPSLLLKYNLWVNRYSLSRFSAPAFLYSPHNYQLQSIAWPQHPRSPPSGPPLSTKPPSALPRPGRKIFKHCTITQRTGFPTWYGSCATTITWMRRWRKSGDIKVRLRSGAYNLLCCTNERD